MTDDQTLIMVVNFLHTLYNPYRVPLCLRSSWQISTGADAILIMLTEVADEEEASSSLASILAINL